MVPVVVVLFCPFLQGAIVVVRVAAQSRRPTAHAPAALAPGPGGLRPDSPPTRSRGARSRGAVCAASVAVLKEKRSNGSSRRQTCRTSEAMRGGCGCGAEQGAVGAALCC